jgi:hypothetical protein
MSSSSKKFYNFLIKLYPEDFQKQHGVELQQTFNNMVVDSGIIKTWFAILPDFIASAIKINLESLMRNSSLQFKLAIIGLVMLIPFGFFVALAIMGNLFHLTTNEIIGQNIAQNLILAKFLLIALPAAAFFMNLVPLASNTFEQKSMSHVLTPTFVRTNIPSLVVAAGGIGALVLLFGHDTVPCIVHGLMNQHFQNIIPLINVCKNA